MGFLRQPPDATGPHPQQRAYQHGVVPVPHGRSPATIRAASPKVRALSPAAAPFHQARVSAPAPTPAAPSAIPSAATIAKELEKHFVTEVAADARVAVAGGRASTDPVAHRRPRASLYACEHPRAVSYRGPDSRCEKPPHHQQRSGSGPQALGHGDGDGAARCCCARPRLTSPSSPTSCSSTARVPGPRPSDRKKLMIRVNQFISNVSQKNLFCYDVSIKPESKCKAGDKQVLSELIKLNQSQNVKLETSKAQMVYKITIRIVGRTDLYHLQQVFRPRQSYITVPRSFLSITFSHRGNTSEGLECWGGYYQILRPTLMGLSLVIDMPVTSFSKHATGVQSAPGFLNLRDASRPRTYMDQVKIKKEVPGLHVETGLTPIPVSQLIFLGDERGTIMAVLQYFRQRMTGSASPVYLALEAGNIVEGQRYSKEKLNNRQFTGILRAICQRPHQREPSIQEVSINPVSKSTAVNREVLNEPIELHGRTSVITSVEPVININNFQVYVRVIDRKVLLQVTLDQSIQSLTEAALSQSAIKGLDVYCRSYTKVFPPDMTIRESGIAKDTSLFINGRLRAGAYWIVQRCPLLVRTSLIEEMDKRRARDPDMWFVTIVVPLDL
ncbi:protein argonaute mel1-like [Hordeum vulgare]|nr:protein argonaute mel1-like [Hordeum vulgare]